jgi:hypothetical protein
MIGRLIRMLFAFVLACLAGALAKILFIFTPGELLGLPTDVFNDRLATISGWTIFAGLHSAIWAAPFALGAAALAEARSIRGPIYFLFVAVLIALLGFVAQYASEASGQATIVNNYAMLAFIVAGLVAGFVYWLLAGRLSGADHGPTPAPRKSLLIDSKPAR